MTTPLSLRFVLSAPDVAELPHSPAEVAVVGRSNVGKSSLLNALAARKELAKVSGTPGKTRLLNLFETDGGTIVDLPGYGYAKVSQAERRSWERRMHRYLLEREPLVLTLLLIDGEVGPTALDAEMLDWVRDHDVPIQIVATKHDKVRSSKRDRRKRDLAAGCEVDQGAIAWVSADKGVGLDRLRGIVRDALTTTSRRGE